MNKHEIYYAAATDYFNVTSGALRVTDPCYGTSVHCSGVLNNVKNGRWGAQVGYTTDWYTVRACLRRLGRRSELIESVSLVPRPNADGKDEYLEDLKRKRTEDLERIIQGNVAILHIRHETKLPLRIVDFHKYLNSEGVEGYTRTAIDVGVDSGQAGFFDLTAYESIVGPSTNNPGFEEFYTRICDATWGPSSVGLAKLSDGIPFGVASTSGWGDGSYNCYEKRNNNGELEAAYILFLANGEDSEPQGDL